jgi:hypothetical protein
VVSGLWFVHVCFVAELCLPAFAGESRFIVAPECSWDCQRPAAGYQKVERQPLTPTLALALAFAFALALALALTTKQQ